MTYIPKIGDRVHVKYLTRKKGSRQFVFMGAVECVDVDSSGLCVVTSIQVRGFEDNEKNYQYNSRLKTWYDGLMYEEVKITKIEEAM